MVETIPSFGLGTFRVDAEKTANAVKSALQLGYCHIDTAKFYNNEEAVGNPLSSSSVRSAAALRPLCGHSPRLRDGPFRVDSGPTGTSRVASY
jgi:aryl-alcohol dehydrogenase-like predicted oxidoreductase